MKAFFVVCLLLCSSLSLAAIHQPSSLTLDKSAFEHRNLKSHRDRLTPLEKIFRYNERYDHLFKRWADEYVPQSDYQLVKAMCTVESRLNPNARSNHGAKGLCQILPGTWRVLRRQLEGLPHNGSLIPTHSIRAASFHIQRLNRFWDHLDYDANKKRILLASYNAGEGNIAKAYKLCGKSSRYERIMRCLPKVTGRHAKETLQYVNLVIHLTQQT